MFGCVKQMFYNGKNSDRQNSTHRTPLIHKNTKTTLNNLPKITGFWGLSENNYFSQSCWITLYLKSATIFMICTSYHKSHNTSHHPSHLLAKEDQRKPQGLLGRGEETGRATSLFVAWRRRPEHEVMRKCFSIL